MTKLPPCDCLNYCGDDPWLARGKARPCGHKEKRDAEAAQRGERQAVLNNKLSKLRELMAQISKDAAWSKAKCGCNHPACTDSYFPSFTRTDGRICNYEADFIILAREYFTLLFTQEP